MIISIDNKHSFQSNQLISPLEPSTRALETFKFDHRLFASKHFLKRFHNNFIPRSTNKTQRSPRFPRLASIWFTKLQITRRSSGELYSSSNRNTKRLSPSFEVPDRSTKLSMQVEKARIIFAFNLRNPSSIFQVQFLGVSRWSSKSLINDVYFFYVGQF